MNKKAKSIIFIILFQFIVTACVPCKCDPKSTFERKYMGLELKAWDTSGFQNSEIMGPVNKNSFGLTISVLFELKQIALYESSLKISSFGFASAYACSCPDDEYINVDPIDSIRILVTNTENQIEVIVTDNFTTYGYDGKKITIRELFEIKAEWHDGFQLDLTDYENIPDSSIFTVKIYLDSGIELTKQTEQINFEN